MKRRGFYSSWVICGSFGGFLVGSAVASAVTTFAGDAAVNEFWWRVPFLAGALIMAAAFVLRRSVEEPEAEAEEAVEAEEEAAARVEEADVAGSPVIHALRHHWGAILRVFGLALAVNVGYYMMFVYAVSYLTDEMHVSTAAAMDINTLCLVLIVIVPLFSALFSDRFGRKTVLVSGLLGMIVLSWPLFWLMHHDDLVMIFLGQAGFALVFGWVYGANPATMVEILPRSVRVSALSIGYNGALALFGGTTPLVATYLLQRTGDDFAPVWYLIALSVVSLAVALSIPETARRPLRE